MKKATLILVVLILFSIRPTVYAVDAGKASTNYPNVSAFTDASSIDARYRDAIEYVAKEGIITGYADKSFAPKAMLTRGAAAKFIASLDLGAQTAFALTATVKPFADVSLDNVFLGYIAYCASNGYINGYADGTFGAGKPLTAGAFAKMLLNAVDYQSDTTRYIGDGWIDRVYQDAFSCGIFTSDVTFEASEVVTREQAAFMLYNAIKYAENSAEEDEKENQANNLEHIDANPADWEIDININNDEDDLYTDLESVRIGSTIQFHTIILDGPNEKIRLRYEIEFSTGETKAGSWDGEAGVNSYANCWCRYTDSSNTEIRGVFKLYNATTGELLEEKAFTLTSPEAQKVYYRSGLLSYQSYVGVECKGSFSSNGVYTSGYTSGDSIYVYDFTTVDDFNSYLKYLTANNWDFVASQSTNTYFCYYKSGVLISVWYVEGPSGLETELAEVWITISQ